MKTQLHNAVSRMVILAPICFVCACGGGEPPQTSVVTAKPAAQATGPFAGWPTSEGLAEQARIAAGVKP